MRRLSLLALFAFSSLALAADQTTAGFNAVETARREFHNGKLEAASRILDGAESRGETDGRALDLRGCIMMELGKFEEAQKLFEAAKSKEPPNYGGFHLGDVLRRQQKWSDARDAYRVALRETNIQTTNERLRYAIMLTYLGEKDDDHARDAAADIKFPTESPTYYFTQAAWAFAHGTQSEAKDWMKRASELFPAKSTAWFQRTLFDFGWIKDKPAFASE